MRPREVGTLLMNTHNPRLTFWREPWKHLLWHRIRKAISDKDVVNRLLWLVDLTADKAMGTIPMTRALLAHLAFQEWSKMADEILEGSRNGKQSR
jgi:hypothetical protein